MRKNYSDSEIREKAKKFITIGKKAEEMGEKILKQIAPMSPRFLKINEGNQFLNQLLSEEKSLEQSDYLLDEKHKDKYVFDPRFTYQLDDEDLCAGLQYLQTKYKNEGAISIYLLDPLKIQEIFQLLFSEEKINFLPINQEFYKRDFGYIVLEIIDNVLLGELNGKKLIKVNEDDDSFTYCESFSDLAMGEITAIRNKWHAIFERDENIRLSKNYQAKVRSQSISSFDAFRLYRTDYVKLIREEIKISFNRIISAIKYGEAEKLIIEYDNLLEKRASLNPDYYEAYYSIGKLMNLANDYHHIIPQEEHFKFMLATIYRKEFIEYFHDQIISKNMLEKVLNTNTCDDINNDVHMILNKYCYYSDAEIISRVATHQFNHSIDEIKTMFFNYCKEKFLSSDFPLSRTHSTGSSESNLFDFEIDSFYEYEIDIFYNDKLRSFSENQCVLLSYVDDSDELKKKLSKTLFVEFQRAILCFNILKLSKALGRVNEYFKFIRPRPAQDISSPFILLQEALESKATQLEGLPISNLMDEIRSLIKNRFDLFMKKYIPGCLSAFNLTNGLRYFLQQLFCIQTDKMFETLSYLTISEANDLDKILLQSYEEKTWNFLTTPEISVDLKLIPAVSDRLQRLKPRVTQDWLYEVLTYWYTANNGRDEPEEIKSLVQCARKFDTDKRSAIIDIHNLLLGYYQDPNVDKALVKIFSSLSRSNLFSRANLEYIWLTKLVSFCLGNDKDASFESMLKTEGEKYYLEIIKNKLLTKKSYIYFFKVPGRIQELQTICQRFVNVRFESGNNFNLNSIEVDLLIKFIQNLYKSSTLAEEAFLDKEPEVLDCMVIILAYQLAAIKSVTPLGILLQDYNDSHSFYDVCDRLLFEIYNPSEESSDSERNLP